LEKCEFFKAENPKKLKKYRLMAKKKNPFRTRVLFHFSLKGRWKGYKTVALEIRVPFW
jgi:hypothetical protein